MSEMKWSELEKNIVWASIMFPLPSTSSFLPGTSTQTSGVLGFGDLCRYFYRALKDDFDDYTAHTVNILSSYGIEFIQNITACNTHDWVLEEKQVSILWPGGDVPHQHAAQPGQRAAS